MQCQNCGATNDEGSTFCIICGKRMAPARPQPTAVKSTPAGRPAAGKRGKIPWYVFAIAGAVLLGMCVLISGVAVYFLLKPESGRIAYAVNWEQEEKPGLYLMDSDGENVQLLVPIAQGKRIEYLAWSPDGKSIAYVIRDDANDYTLWKVEVKTGDTTRVTENVDNSPHPFDWSPDSRQIVLTTLDNVIYLVNADGSDDTRMAPGMVPFWSPKGDTIAYAQYGESYDESAAMLISSDGSEKNTLREDRDTMYIPYGWSPDGDWLLVHVTDEDEIHDIWLISREGEEEIKLTNTRDYNDILPSFSPDGRWIAYFSCDGDSDSDCDIYIVRKDGTDRKRLIMHMEENWLFWSADSEALIYVTEDGEVERVEIDSGQKTTLTEKIDSLCLPAYAP